MRHGAPPPPPRSVPGTLLNTEETTMLHVHLYRARRRHQALAEAIDEETRRLAPNAERLA